ncbi:MAG: Crp/Fnr family transcriptional regulator [Gammaproteobacteria bacterium]|nr:Crp/Fnr family transcriptional regulator [Gammaproteobacteria bacterium]
MPNGCPIAPTDLGRQALFAGLAEANLARIAEAGSIIDVKRGERVLSRGDRLDGLYVLLSGSLKLYVLSCGGDERVLRVLAPGDSFGEAIMFNRIPSPVFVESLASARLAFFPREVITDVLVRAPDFTDTMLRSMSNLMHQLIQDLETCCLHNALQRTVHYLLRKADAAPTPHVEVQLPASKAVVASMLNMSAETFSRELHRLQDEGLIEINRRVIYLRSRDGLIDLAQGSLKPQTAH